MAGFLDQKEEQEESVEEIKDRVKALNQVPQVKDVNTSGEFRAVPQAALEQLLRELSIPMDLKVKVVDLIQTNNREKVKSYTIDFIPGMRIKIENGRIVK